MFPVIFVNVCTRVVPVIFKILQSSIPLPPFMAISSSNLVRLSSYLDCQVTFLWALYSCPWLQKASFFRLDVERRSTMRWEDKGGKKQWYASHPLAWFIIKFVWNSLICLCPLSVYFALAASPHFLYLTLFL